jgi:hypothetical protein
MFQTEQVALRRVRFCSRSEPLLALHVLDAVFCHPTNMLSVMTKNRDLVLELWLYLDRIKVRGDCSDWLSLYSES